MYTLPSTSDSSIVTICAPSMITRNIVMTMPHCVLGLENTQSARPTPHSSSTSEMIACMAADHPPAPAGLPASSSFDSPSERSFPLHSLGR